MANRKQSRLAIAGVSLLAKLWQIRLVLLLSVPYLALLAWLFSGDSAIDLRPSGIYSVPEEPRWEKPSDAHWFGTTGNGVDLLQLSRRAIGTSVAVAVITSALGIGLGFLLTALFAFDSRQTRFRILFGVSRSGFILPAMLLLILFVGGAGPSLLLVMAGLTVLIGLHLAPVIATWFLEGEQGPHFTAGIALGLSRVDIMRHRVLPRVLGRLVGTFARLVPMITLAEMSISFLGLSGDRLSVGTMVAAGQNFIIEAPWLSLCPGGAATVVVAILAGLGWAVSSLLRTGSIPRFI